MLKAEGWRQAGREEEGDTRMQPARLRGEELVERGQALYDADLLGTDRAEYGGGLLAQLSERLRASGIARADEP